MLEFKEVNKDNFNECIKLRVDEAQSTYVAPNVYSLAQAFANNGYMFPMGIYDDDLFVGFFMLGHLGERHEICRFMIDKNYQNKGYGKQAFGMVLNYFIEKFHPTQIFLTCNPDNNIAKNMYKTFGFFETGEVIGSELEMKFIV